MQTVLVVAGCLLGLVAMIAAAKAGKFAWSFFEQLASEGKGFLWWKRK